MENRNRQVLLKRRPAGAPTPADFAITDAPLPDPGEGEVLVRGIYLSLDPYARADQRPAFLCPAGRGRCRHRRPRRRRGRALARSGFWRGRLCAGRVWLAALQRRPRRGS